MQYFRGATAVEYLAVRVDQGEEVLEAINRTVAECQLAAGAVLSGVGTLEFVSLEVPANLMWPPAVYATKNQGPAQIISAGGHIASGQVDLYVTVARRNEVHAGKVMEGTKALHGVEFTLLRAGNTRWSRVPNPQTGAPMLQATSATPTEAVTFKGRPLDMAVVNLVPKQLLQKHRCLPVIKNDRTLIVAMLDPNDPFAIDDLRAATGLHIQAVAVPVNELMPALQQVLQART